MELASSARQLGADVTLIEAAARPLARLLPAAFSARLMEMHQTSGVQVLLNAAVESLSPGRVSLVDGREIYVDTIVIGIGAQPNDEIASDAGLHVRDGIVVDTQGRSSNAAIYAVGDVARHVNLEFGLDYRLESWRNAEDGALAAAAAICSMPAPARRAPWFWTDQYGHNIQLAGKPIDAHERIERGDPTTGPSISYYLESGIVRGAIAVDCARELRNSMNLIEGGKVVDPAALVGPRLRMPSTVFTPPEVIP
jgi:NADPH-dependent 2,4-dienoyl-CoA reductase/sulfur reductase-like enzyme